MKRLLLIGSVAAVALSLAGSAVAVPSRPCYPTYCSHSLRVGATAVHWQTQRFKALTTLEARYRGHVLGYWNAGCRSYSSGYGIVVRFDGCGPGAQHVRVTAISLRSRPVTIRIVYG